MLTFFADYIARCLFMGSERARSGLRCIVLISAVGDMATLLFIYITVFLGFSFLEFYYAPRGSSLRFTLFSQ